MSKLSVPQRALPLFENTLICRQVAWKQWWDPASLQRPRLKSHVLVSQGFIVLRFAKYALGGFLSKSLWIDFIVFYPFVCFCLCVWNFSLVHWPVTFCHPSLTFLLMSAFKLLFPPLNIWQPKPSCAFIPLCLHYDITCAKWPSSPILVCKICNIFWDGSVLIFGILSLSEYRVKTFCRCGLFRGRLRLHAEMGKRRKGLPILWLP